MPRAKCYCGCGQAPGTSCRQRLLTCTGCSVKARMSREALATVSLSCSCGGTMAPTCLEDLARSGDETAWSELRFKLQRSEMSADAGRRSGQVRRARREAAELSADEIADRMVASGNTAAMAVLSPGAVRAAEMRKAAGDDLPF